MIRKLLLSVVGAFFSSKSVLCVTCGMLISLCGLLAHVHYYPFKSLTCNRLQSLSLSVLTFIYLVGILLKTDSMQHQDGDNLGKLLVSLLATVFAAAFGTIVLTVWTAVRWIRQIKYAKAAIEAEPAFDPALTEHMIDVSLLKLSR
jgi:hypothetical protein